MTWLGNGGFVLPKTLADISQNLQVNQKPKELWVTRPEYKAYPLNVFRDHIHSAGAPCPQRAPILDARRAEKEAEKAKSSSATKTLNCTTVLYVSSVAK
jgi:hypothetical protein